LIQNQIVEQLAKKEGVYPSDADIQNLYKEVIYLQDKKSVKPFEKQLSDLGLTPAYFQQDQILPHLCQINLAAKGLKITDQDLNSYYSERLADEFTVHSSAHIQRMVLTTKAEADKISSEIKAGKSFDEMYSKSESKDPDFGDIPQWIALDDKDPQFLPVITALNATPVGSVTAPISFQGAFWIIKVVEKRPAEIIPQNKVPATLREGLMQEKSGADSARLTAFEGELNAAQRNADIKVMDPQYKDLVTELKNPPDISKLTAPTSH
jgi:parvulin-like peptidyl-prolyl isomerase